MSSNEDGGWRAPAVVAADEGARRWRQAVHEQGPAAPSHTDFYELGGSLVDTLRALEAMARVLGVQVAGYGKSRTLRDDAGEDPTARLASAARHLGRTRELIGEAERSANAYWSAISHIAVEDQRRRDRGL